MTKMQPCTKKKQVATEANLEALTQRQATWLLQIGWRYCLGVFTSFCWGEHLLSQAGKYPLALLVTFKIPVFFERKCNWMKHLAMSFRSV